MSATPNTPPAAAPQSVVWTDASRQALFETWFARIQSTHQLAASTLRLASADASFRRYLRVDSVVAGTPTTRIIMDAPPDKGECKPFVAVADLIPGLHKRTALAATLQQVLLITAGIATILLARFLVGH